MANDRFSKKYTPKNGLPDFPIIKVIVVNRASPGYETQTDFLIDSGADVTIVGDALIEELHLKGKGSLQFAVIGERAKPRKTTKIYIEISEIKFRKSIDAIMVEPDEEQANEKTTMELLNRNYLGRDFLNKINVFLLGNDLKFWINVRR